MTTPAITAFMQTTAFAGDNPGPQTAEEYNARKNALVEVASALGYDAEVKYTPAHYRNNTAVDIMETFEVNSGTIYSQAIRYGNDVSGLIQAELWLNAECAEKSKAERDRKALAKSSRVVGTVGFVGDANPLDRVSLVKDELAELKAELAELRGDL